MIDYDNYFRIHYSYTTLKMTKAQIARDLGLAESTVRFWLKKDSYVKKSYTKRKTLLDPYKDEIAQHLVKCPTYSAVQIFNFLQLNGYTGGLTTVKNYLHSIRPVQKRTYMQLRFSAGEAMQVDWGCAGYIMIGDKKRKISYFVAVDCFSRLMFAKFTLSEAQEAWNECHRDTFEFFGGVPEKVIVDNCKTAVIKNVKGLPILYNQSYMALAKYYNFQIVACNVRSPWEKGRVENGVNYVRGSFIRGRNLEPFEQLNVDCRNWLDNTANIRIHNTTLKRPVDLHKEPNLQALPVHPYDCTRKEVATVSKDYRIRVDSNTYTVPSEYAYKTVNLEISSQCIRIWYKGHLIAECERHYDRKKDYENEQHSKALLQKNKQAEEQKMTEWLLRISSKGPDFFKQLKERSPRLITQLRQLFALGQIHTEEQIAKAIEDALFYNACNAEYVRNILEAKLYALPEVGPLNVTHKSDALDMKLNSPNMKQYEDK